LVSRDHKKLIKYLEDKRKGIPISPELEKEILELQKKLV